MLVLWVCAWASFVSAETVVIIAFSGIPNGHLFLGIGSKFIVPFLVSLPMIAGTKGYYDAQHRLVIDNGQSLITTLPRQFLFAIIVSYAAVIVCVSHLTEALGSVK
jgi:hypothetical protein